MLARLIILVLLGVTLFTTRATTDEPVVTVAVEIVEDIDAEQELALGHESCTSSHLYVTPAQHHATSAPSSIAGDGVFRPPRASLS